MFGTEGAWQDVRSETQAPNDRATRCDVAMSAVEVR